MGNLFLLCGKPGSGKTTLAEFLKTEYSAIHFSSDDFMLNLFGEIKDRNIFNQKLLLCKNLIYGLCDQILLNNNVVLDFGFWTEEERIYVKRRFEKFNVVIIYLRLDDNEIYKRIEKRNKALKSNEYYIDRPTFNLLCKRFEEPKGNEKFITYTNMNQLLIDLKMVIKLK